MDAFTAENMVSNKVNTVLNFVIIVVGHLWPAIKTITTLKVSGYLPTFIPDTVFSPDCGGVNGMQWEKDSGRKHSCIVTLYAHADSALQWGKWN